MSKHNSPSQWLKSGDQFVDEAQPDSHRNACVGRQLPDWHGTQYYSDGFRIAARRLVQDVLEESSVELPIDLVVYPILFLYRHHFELLLKMLIGTSRSLLSEQGRDPFGHRLAELWGVARPLVERCYPDADWSQNDIVGSLFGELSGYDPNGEAGRYPFSSKGEKHFKQLRVLNVRHFADVAERLSDYLAEVLTAIGIADEQRAEYEADFRDYYG